ncbi:MAG TPA: hypothetical protein VE974_19370 [Thermoanaerobaculia bacterium]|nr:hypothetical protein [Thermoanaerobaculia bacterium]
MDRALSARDGASESAPLASFLTLDPKATIEELTLLPASDVSERPLKMRMSGSEASVDGVPPGIWMASALVRAGDGALYPIRAGELKV